MWGRVLQAERTSLRLQKTSSQHTQTDPGTHTNVPTPHIAWQILRHQPTGRATERGNVHMDRQKGPTKHLLLFWEHIHPFFPLVGAR